MNNKDITGKELLCERCGIEIVGSYYVIDGQIRCSRCFYNRYTTKKSEEKSNDKSKE